MSTIYDPFASVDTSKDIPLWNPATLEPLDPPTTAVHSPDTVRAAVASARAAQTDSGWATSTFDQRDALLRALLDSILDSQDAICEWASLDSGKTLVDAMLGEVYPVCEKLKFTLDHGRAALAPEPRPVGLLQNKAARVEYEPLGVCGIICPWNFPFHNILCPLIPVLYAGNAAVVKVSECTTWSSIHYARLIHEVLDRCGWPRALVQFVHGYGPTGEALVRSGVDKIFFTGSPQNGRKVMAAASDTLTPVVLELGGKDAMIVCDDADLDQAVAASMLGVFTACGQMCVSSERLFVHRNVVDEFVERVLSRLSKTKQGAPCKEACDFGATTMPRQLTIIDDLVQDALAKGARALAGARIRTDKGGQFYEPTVLVDITPDMRIMQEEHFGPIMVISVWDDDQEVVDMANNCAYGLGSSVFSTNYPRAEKIAHGVRAGMSVINDYGIAYMCQSLPFGGVKISGIGRINGQEGLRACCHIKAYVTDRFPIRVHVPKAFQYPVSADAFAIAKDIARSVYGQGITRRLGAAFGAVKKLARL